MAYYYATPKQRGQFSCIYSKAKKISDIGPALAHKSVFPDSLKNGDMIRVCKKTKRNMMAQPKWNYMQTMNSKTGN